jgi:SAM-dependent methyltransferase
MDNSFKDHFSHDSASYAKHRPGYPGELFEFLASLCPDHELAWDCATGTGQSALQLANHFDRVIATDASSSQVENAIRHPQVNYRVASAEDSGIETNTVNLVTVAQALHWFDLDAFTREVSRTLKPGSILAVWTYNLLTINPDIDALVNHLYSNILGDYWPFERRMVEQGYAGITLPFAEISVPAFKITTAWNAEQLLDYLSTWSAVNAYKSQQGSDPLDQIRGGIYKSWNDGETAELAVEWPLAVRIWRQA